MNGLDTSIIGGSDTDTALFLAGTMGTFVIVFYIIMISFSIACYVLQSLGLYTIAKRLGHERPWLAWIPVGNAWLTGRLSDQFQWITKGKKTNRASILLWLEVGLLASAIILYIIAIALIVSTSGTIVLENTDAGTVMLLAMIMLVLYFVLLGVAITYSVFYYMSLYDIFASCDPSKKVLFLVLSILFGIQCFFIFALRNKDLGMYPPQNMYNQSGYNGYNQNNYNGYNQNNYNNYNGYNQSNYNNYNSYNQNSYNGYNQNGYNQPNNSQDTNTPNNWTQ
ncbi:MAG: hypothetical protein IJV71_03090 [Lachnospiraceae bacterium]|nr:hypothetical protein [Lachnospiraceae bacterium]